MRSAEKIQNIINRFFSLHLKSTQNCYQIKIHFEISPSKSSLLKMSHSINVTDPQ